MAQSNLSKKTKSEIIADYEKLLASFDEAKGAANTLFSAKNEEIITKSKNELTSEQAREAIKKLKLNVSEKLNDFSQSINLSLGQIFDQINAQVENFSQLRKAIDISSDQLRVEHQIEITAESLESLMGEFQSRRNALEQEISAKEKELESEIEAKRMEWEREQEEYGYELKLKRKREEDEYRYIQEQREQSLKTREDEIKKQEDELVRLRKECEETPSRIEKQVGQREQELKKNIEASFKQKYEEDKKELEFDKKITETRIKSLESQIKELEIGLALARKDADTANKKAQELAVKVIEGGTYRQKLSETADKPE
jgi:hypothetical protein